jgi:predicted Zn finger-like uncharacterized protein
MSTLIDCPSCQRKLRVPDEFLGKSVRCPTCGESFRAPEAAAAGEPAPAPAAAGPEPLLNVPLRLELDDQPPAPRPAAEAPRPAEPEPPRRRREPDDEDDRDEPRRRRGSERCPGCGEDVRRGAAVCRYCGFDLEAEDDGAPRRRVRLDAEPHRAGTVQGLGIASLVLAAFYIFPIGIPLGIAAWVMGRRDLAKMGAGVMDPGGRKKTKDGWMCGLIGTCVNGFWAVTCGGVILLAVLEEQSASRTPPPQPAVQQAAWNAGVAPQGFANNYTLTGPAAPVRLARGGMTVVTVLVDRDPGFQGIVTVKVAGRPAST